MSVFQTSSNNHGDLVGLPFSTDPETKIWGQVVSLRGEPRAPQWGGGGVEK